MIVTLKHKKKENWSGLYKYKNCYDYIAPLLTRSGNVHTGLSDEDAERLEKELNFNPGTLAPHSKYWKTFAIKITNYEIVLDTSRAWDELQYLFLKNHKKVSNGINDIKPSAEWILINKEYEAEIANKAARRKIDAIKEYDKMSIEDMRRCLRILGYKSDSMSNELVQNKLYENIEKDPERFFSKWVNNSTKTTEFLIEAALAKNILRRSRNIYYYGTDVIGHSLEDAIANIDNKSNQDIKRSILNELESK